MENALASLFGAGAGGMGGMGAPGGGGGGDLGAMMANMASSPAFQQARLRTFTLASFALVYIC
jgi:hypothetical protein